MLTVRAILAKKTTREIGVILSIRRVAAQFKKIMGRIMQQCWLTLTRLVETLVPTAQLTEEGSTHSTQEKVRDSINLNRKQRVALWLNLMPMFHNSPSIPETAA